MMKKTENPQVLTDNGKIPPQAVDMERAILSACLIESDALPAIIDIVNPDSFYKNAHKEIYSSILDMFNANEPVDILTVTSDLRKKGKLNECGGPVYITELSSEVSSSAHIEHHARIVAEMAMKRGMIEMSVNVIKDSYDSTTDVFELMAYTESRLSDIQGNITNGKVYKASHLVNDQVARIKRASKTPGGVTGITSGLSGIDKFTAGWQNTDLIIIAGRPAMGKCLGKNTPIIMFDGKIKMSQEIEVGDFLMGPDSNPRKVTSLARGREMMYWVRQKRGIDYKVNESHILSLKASKNNSIYYKKGEIRNVSVKDFISLSNRIKDKLKGWKTSSSILTSIDVEKDIIDDYYGFTIDGPDGLFLLGDTTVTHNTDLAINLGINAAKSGNPVAFFSLEMGREQIMDRVTAIDRRVERDHIKTGHLTDDEWERISRFDKSTIENFLIADEPVLNTLTFRSKVRRMAMQKGVKLVIVDYLQLMDSSTKRGNLNERVTDISRTLKLVAKESNIPVIALSQLSRAVETRGGDKRPQLSDLRESGAIEQDADIVIFPYRPEYYGFEQKEDGSSTRQLMEVIFAKNRNGSVGSCENRYLGKFGKVTDWQEPEQIPNGPEKSIYSFKNNGYSDFDTGNNNTPF